MPRAAFAAIVAMAGLAGCAGFSPGLTKLDAPVASNAYLYGRFEIRTATAPINVGFYRSIGLSFACDSGQQILLRLKVEDPVQLLPVSPASKCTLREVVFVERDFTIKGRKPPPTGWVTELQLVPGKAAYIGDFSAAAFNTNEGSAVMTNWEISGVRDNYEATTDAMKKAFPQFAGIVTERRPLVR